ncbi:hypothetical protein ONZ51_g8441 [Trametes cubensis]|uniref:Uncharacterized protein n=1 Tax=Trametes cubensis TaxID=1111947 RepID=A0AAD7TN99_9APHY|nr:hypothetical protein ONZ51_g8441 [Trametes cubensis]
MSSAPNSGNSSSGGSRRSGNSRRTGGSAGSGNPGGSGASSGSAGPDSSSEDRGDGTVDTGGRLSSRSANSGSNSHDSDAESHASLSPFEPPPLRPPAERPRRGAAVIYQEMHGIPGPASAAGPATVAPPSPLGDAFVEQPRAGGYRANRQGSTASGSSTGAIPPTPASPAYSNASEASGGAMRPPTAYDTNIRPGQRADFELGHRGAPGYNSPTASVSSAGMGSTHSPGRGLLNAGSPTQRSAPSSGSPGSGIEGIPTSDFGPLPSPPIFGPAMEDSPTLRDPTEYPDSMPILPPRQPNFDRTDLARYVAWQNHLRATSLQERGNPRLVPNRVRSQSADLTGSKKDLERQQGNDRRHT